MIRIRDLCLKQGEFELDQVSLEVASGRYGVLMGRTGSGKSTILESICGLRKIASGCIELMGRDVTQARPAERGVGYVPQDGALFATMTVREHLAFPLTVRKRPPSEIAARVSELAGLLGIGYLLERRPEGLSGGERQRVALGRALAFHPGVLCLDEPLSALDEDTREEMCRLLIDVRKATGVTVLHVTHSRREARRLADTVLVLREGRVVQMAPQELDAVRPEKESRSPATATESAT